MAGKSYNNQLSGEYGGVGIANTSANTGDFQGFLVITDSVVAAYTGTITGFPTATIIKAGTYVAGAFTSITLTSGTVIAYKRKY